MEQNDSSKKKLERPVFDRTQVREEAEAAIDQVGENSSDAWLNVLRAGLVEVLFTVKRFTADHVWHVLDIAPPNKAAGSALGFVMREAAREGHCQPTGDYSRSTRAGTHGKPLPVWESLVMEGDGGEAERAA